MTIEETIDIVVGTARATAAREDYLYMLGDGVDERDAEDYALGAAQRQPHHVLVGLVAHTFQVHTPDGVVEVPPSGVVTRVATETMQSTLDIGRTSIPVAETRMVGLTDLPARRAGVTFIASLVVAQAASAAGRDDVCSPGPLIRGLDGQPIGCQGLARPSPSERADLTAPTDVDAATREGVQ